MESKKKYKVIAKVGNEKFVKYNVNNLLLFTNFLDDNFTDWRWFNVYELASNGKGPQIANFTKSSRPSKRFV